MHSPTIMALSSDDGVIQKIALFTEYGAFVRDAGEWVSIEDDAVEPEEDAEDPIDGLIATPTDENFVLLWDSAVETGGTLLTGDVPVAA